MTSYPFINCVSTDDIPAAMTTLEALGKIKITKTGMYQLGTLSVVLHELSLEDSDALITLVRRYKTNNCYNTNGGVSSDGKLLDVSRKWQRLPEYQILLNRFLQERNLEDKKEIVEIVEQSFRVKQARGFTYVLYACCWGDTEYIAFSLAPESKQSFPNVPIVFRSNLKQIEQSACDACGKITTFRCSKCRQVFYCSKSCQSKKWQEHCSKFHK